MKDQIIIIIEQLFIDFLYSKSFGFATSCVFLKSYLSKFNGLWRLSIVSLRELSKTSFLKILLKSIVIRAISYEAV